MSTQACVGTEFILSREVVSFFFFSRRRGVTSFEGDWGSEVCSSALFLGGGRLLRGDAPQKTTQEPSQRRVDQGLAVSGSPDDVAIDAIDHGRNPATGFLSERHRISAGWARFGPPAASRGDWRPSGRPLGAAPGWETTPPGGAGGIAAPAR